MEFKKMDLKKKLLLINDIIILLLNIFICIILFIISHQEKNYRGSSKLFTFQCVQIIIIIILDIFLNVKNIMSNFKGHNKYGMLIRFIMFYFIIPCVILTYQKSNNLNHNDIKNAGNTVFYIGFINNGFIILSMILSFIVIDTQKEEKILVNKHRKSISMSAVDNMKLLEESNISHLSNQGYTDIEKKEE